MTLKKTVTLILSIMLSSIALSASTFIDHDALLTGIRQVETGGKYWKIGLAGERSQYQIKRCVWETYSNVPFWRASQLRYQDEARRVALCYIEDISNKLVRLGIEVSVQNIAARWNGGISKSRFSRKNLSYANRVTNVYDDHSQSIEVTSVVKIDPPINVVINVEDDTIDDEPVIRVDIPGRQWKSPQITPLIATL